MHKFESFVRTFQNYDIVLSAAKHYDSEEIENSRMLSFLENFEEIRDHNILYTKGERSFELGPNHIADLVNFIIYLRSVTRCLLRACVLFTFFSIYSILSSDSSTLTVLF